MRRYAAALAIFLALPTVARAQDTTEPMPSLGRMDAASTALATACGGTDAAACTTLADRRLRASAGAEANALYRRAADLARAATTPRTPTLGPTTVRSVADAIRALETAWSGTAVPAATAHGMGAMAVDARAQIFGAGAVTSWTGRRARRADAFRAVHTMRTREEATFANLAWIGDDAALAAPGDVWELTFAWMNLDFRAYVADDGSIVALVHFPEG